MLLWWLWLSSRFTIRLASSVICRSMPFRCSLYVSMWRALRSASLISRSTSRSTLSLPHSMRPLALMRGPILKMISLIDSSRPLSPHTSTMALRPTLGFWLSCFSPWKARMRFSSTTGTRSAAMLTAQKSSSGMRREKGMPLFLAKACINLNPTPQPQSSLNG